MMLNLF